MLYCSMCNQAYFLVNHGVLLKLVLRCTTCRAVTDTELNRGSGGAAVKATGRCPDCDCLFNWRLSELVPETQIAHIDLLLSAAILFIGSEIVQTLCQFQFMDIAVGTQATFHRHQVTHFHKIIRYVWKQ